MQRSNGAAGAGQEPKRPGKMPQAEKTRGWKQKKQKMYICYEEMRMKVPDKDDPCNEELVAAEKFWNDKGYTLDKEYNEEQQSVMDLNNNYDKPSLLLVTTFSDSLEEIQELEMNSISSAEVGQEDVQDYINKLIMTGLIQLLTEVVRSIPFYQNENLLDHLNNKVAVVYDWVIASINVGTISGSTDGGQEQLQKQLSVRPNFSQQLAPLVVTADKIVINDVTYIPLLFSSLTPGSMLNIDGKMSSVFDAIPELDAKTPLIAVVEEAMKEFGMSCGAKLGPVLAKRLSASSDLPLVLSGITNLFSDMCSLVATQTPPSATL